MIGKAAQQALIAHQFGFSQHTQREQRDRAKEKKNDALEWDNHLKLFFFCSVSSFFEIK